MARYCITLNIIAGNTLLMGGPNSIYITNIVERILEFLLRLIRAENKQSALFWEYESSFFII